MFWHGLIFKLLIFPPAFRLRSSSHNATFRTKVTRRMWVCLKIMITLRKLTIVLQLTTWARTVFTDFFFFFFLKGQGKFSLKDFTVSFPMARGTFPWVQIGNTASLLWARRENITFILKDSSFGCTNFSFRVKIPYSSSLSASFSNFRTPHGIPWIPRAQQAIHIDELGLWASYMKEIPAGPASM